MDASLPGPAPSITLTLREWSAIEHVLTATGTARATLLREQLRPEGLVDPAAVLVPLPPSRADRTQLGQLLRRAARRAAIDAALIDELTSDAVLALAGRLDPAYPGG